MFRNCLLNWIAEDGTHFFGPLSYGDWIQLFVALLTFCALIATIIVAQIDRKQTVKIARQSFQLEKHLQTPTFINASVDVKESCISNKSAKIKLNIKFNNKSNNVLGGVKPYYINSYNMDDDINELKQLIASINTEEKEEDNFQLEELFLLIKDDPQNSEALKYLSNCYEVKSSDEINVKEEFYLYFKNSDKKNSFLYNTGFGTLAQFYVVFELYTIFNEEVYYFFDIRYFETEHNEQQNELKKFEIKHRLYYKVNNKFITIEEYLNQ